jgi:hypothetical protein
MDIKDLTEEQKIEIAKELCNSMPLQTIGHVAAIQLGKLAVTTNGSVEVMTEATFDKIRYYIKMRVEIKEYFKK